jgi:hypothetical protein
MTTPTPPGWYDDPEDANAQRYWDGQAWTPHRHRKPLSGQSSTPNLPPPQLPRRPTSRPSHRRINRPRGCLRVSSQPDRYHNDRAIRL